MSKRFVALIVAVSALLAYSASAAELEGVKLPDKIRLTGGGPELVLNGAGIRHKFGFIKIYVATLYLSQKKNEREAALADPGPKRVGMHILADEVTAPDLISSMNNALAANLVPHELALLEKRLRDLNRMMSSIKTIGKGSVVYLDYIPGTGTRITVNGEERITIPGEDFFRGMLQVWLGAKPVDGGLRDAMLGGKGGFRLF
jgi:flagellar motor switch/type III secretory pathway protein FliN